MDKIAIDPEIVATCSALGNKDENTGRYEKDLDCDACLRDLLRFLRKDNDDFLIRRQLAATNVVTNDLIFILKDHCADEKELFDVLLRLLCNLTNPAILLFNEEVPTDKHKKVLYLELLEILFNYKIAFSSHLKCWSVLTKHMTDIISTDVDERTHEDSLLFERILILVRNLLHVPIDSYKDQSTNEDMNPHDRMIVMMRESGMSDMIMLLASSEDEGHFCFHVLEIVSLMMREQDPEFLVKSFDPTKKMEEQVTKKRNEFEKSKDDQELELILSREKGAAKPKVRHRFKEATYQIKNVKSLSGGDLIYHKPVTEKESLVLGEKQILRKAKNRRALRDADFGSAEYDELKVHKSVPKVRAYLSQFAREFLESYNQLMLCVRGALKRKKNPDNDETYYLWAAYFFMEYNRYAKPDVSLVSETYNVDSLHYFHTLITDYIDKIKMEKKNYLPWSRRLHYALKAYRELICTLAFMSGSTNLQFHDVTKKIKWTAFYEEEYRELLVNLFKEFNATTMSRRYLIDLVVTNHVFLKMLKSYCSVNETIAVKVKARKKSKKKRRTKKQIEREEMRWTDMNDELRESLSGVINLPTAEEDEDVLPLDSTVEFEPELQKIAIMKRLKRLLFEEKVTSAVALLRNAREAYPDDPERPFGSPDCTPDDEEMALRDIYDADFLDYEEDENDDDAGGDSAVRRVEKSMQFLDMFKKYCVPRVLIPHITLLKDFDKNSTVTNHAIIKYLHRLAFDYELIGMLFQASIFRILQRILSKPVTDQWSKELNSFAKFVVRKFVEVCPKNPYILVELLFWKHAREGKAVIEGYDEAVMPTDKDDEENEFDIRPPISDDEDSNQGKDGKGNESEGRHSGDEDPKVRRVKRKIFDELDSDEDTRPDPIIAPASAAPAGQLRDEDNGNEGGHDDENVRSAASQLLHEIDDAGSQPDSNGHPLASNACKENGLSQKQPIGDNDVLGGKDLIDYLMADDSEKENEMEKDADSDIFEGDTDKEDDDKENEKMPSSPVERPGSASSGHSIRGVRKKRPVIIDSDDDE